MTSKEQTDAFSDDLDKLIERYRAEFDMTYAQIVGVLVIQQHILIKEALEIPGDD
jgi:hypothetical protein